MDKVLFNNSLFILLLLLFFCFIHYSWAHRLFRGRPLSKHGMLGVPESILYEQQSKLQSAQWYNQRLDHFDPTNLNTWKQVNYKLTFS